MLSKIKLFFFLLLLGFSAFGQTVIPTSDEIILPLYCKSNSGDATDKRLPVVARLKLTGLTANATYRYFPGMSTANNITTTSAP